MSTPDSFHILVTDINHHVRTFLQRELEKEGYAVCSVKTCAMAYERISSSAPLDLIIVDPELFHQLDQTVIEDIMHRRSSLQIIIHAYADSILEIQPGNRVHLVEKNGQSLQSMKIIISRCFALFQENQRLEFRD